MADVGLAKSSATLRSSQHRGVMLLSVRPRFAQRILDGTKTVELRRTRPCVRNGQPVLLYVTLPVGAVLATCRIHQVQEAGPDALWRRVRAEAAVSRDEFEEYARGSERIVALHIDQVRPLPTPLTLADLRADGPFHPPQTWHFLDAARLARLTADHPAAPRLAALLAASLEPRDPKVRTASSAGRSAR